MLLCGLGPALKALKTDLVAMLRGVAIPGTVRSDLIVTQVALSTMLLVTAVVLVHSVYASLAQDRGFTSERVAMTTVALPRDGTPLSRVTFLETLLERVEHAPGVAAATIVENIPLANNSPIASALFRADGRQAQVSLNRVSRGLFDTLEIALLAGRDFTGGDNSSAAAVGIVNETLARTFWREESPIGKFLKDKSGALVEIVGLARDSKYDALEEPSKPFLYRPLAQAPTVTPTFLIKAIGDRSTVIDLVRTRLAELDSTLAAFNVMALDDRLALGLVMNRAAATVSGSLGLLALLLGSVGIYGTMSYLARQRQREIGIRLALGASYSQVIRLITSQGMVWVGGGLAVGLALGLIAALGLSRVVRGVSPTDPLAFVVTPLVLAAAGYLACHLPARRASRLDPLVALRDE
jgi:putative ABC transport system permease protein